MADDTPLWATLCIHCFENRKQDHDSNKCADIWDASYYENGDTEQGLTGFCICPRCRVAKDGRLDQSHMPSPESERRAMPPLQIGPNRVRF